jgi:hypothetical protein
MEIQYWSEPEGLVPSAQAIVRFKEYAIETQLADEVHQRGSDRQRTTSAILKTCTIDFTYM